jgi:hypothetical protein
MTINGVISVSSFSSHYILGTKREAELDDVSPSKLKALKAARNGRNGDGPADDESSNHKNGDDHLHDEEDDDDDDVRDKN